MRLRLLVSPTLPVSALAVLAVAVLALSGCPRELEPPPAAGTVCEAHAECNPPEMTCGELRLCVGGRCEAGHSLHVPCR